MSRSIRGNVPVAVQAAAWLLSAVLLALCTSELHVLWRTSGPALNGGADVVRAFRDAAAAQLATIAPWPAFAPAPPLDVVTSVPGHASPVALSLSCASVLPLRSPATGLPMSLHYVGHPLLSMFHFAVGVLWAAFAPLQLSDIVRQRAPKVHNTLGSVVAFSGFSIGVSGLLFMVLRAHTPLATTGEWTWHDAVTAAAGVWLLATYFRAYVTATNADFVAHRDWSIRHVGAGYWVGLARVAYIVLPLTLPSLAAAGDTPAQAEGRLFALVNVASMAVTIATAEWVVRQRRSSAKAVHVD